ncbi:MAG: insulinase family protein, partial [Tannerella sp.]|nr:insulinase family protein [Tannerella sp.]
FESLLFDGHPLGHRILGNRRSLRTLKAAQIAAFVRRYYTNEHTVFFFMGGLNAARVMRMVERYFLGIPSPAVTCIRTPPDNTLPNNRLQQVKRNTRQSHVLTGGRGYDMYDARRIPLFLLNNLLGGPGMNSRLNVALRERNGLVYQVESNVTFYTDAGWYAVYFGASPRDRAQAQELVERELRRLCTERLSDFRLSAARKQAIGQMSVATDQRESLFLGLGKSFLHFNRYESYAEVCRRIEAVTSGQLLEVANELFAPEQRLTLIYE